MDGGGRGDGGPSSAVRRPQSRAARISTIQPLYRSAPRALPRYRSGRFDRLRTGFDASKIPEVASCLFSFTGPGQDTILFRPVLGRYDARWRPATR